MLDVQLCLYRFSDKSTCPETLFVQVFRQIYLSRNSVCTGFQTNLLAQKLCLYRFQTNLPVQKLCLYRFPETLFVQVFRNSVCTGFQTNLPVQKLCLYRFPETLFVQVSRNSVCTIFLDEDTCIGDLHKHIS